MYVPIGKYVPIFRNDTPIELHQQPQDTCKLQRLTLPKPGLQGRPAQVTAVEQLVLTVVRGHRDLRRAGRRRLPIAVPTEAAVVLS